MNCGTYPEFNELSCREAGLITNTSLEGASKLCVLEKESSLYQFMKFVLYRIFLPTAKINLKFFLSQINLVSVWKNFF